MSKPASTLSPSAAPRGSARWLREALRYQQMRNRLAAADYRAGVRRAKDIGAAMRALAIRARQPARPRLPPGRRDPGETLAPPHSTDPAAARTAP